MRAGASSDLVVLCEDAFRDIELCCALSDGDQQEEGRRASEAAQAAGGRALGERRQPAHAEEEALGGNPGLHGPAGPNVEGALPVSWRCHPCAFRTLDAYVIYNPVRQLSMKIHGKEMWHIDEIPK